MFVCLFCQELRARTRCSPYNRKMFPNGGYVPANGIALCADCHKKAEQYHSTGIPYPGYSIEDLYMIIGSSFEQAKREDSRG
jgi:hypothetical protein